MNPKWVHRVGGTRGLHIMLWTPEPGAPLISVSNFVTLISLQVEKGLAFMTHISSLLFFSCLLVTKHKISDTPSPQSDYHVSAFHMYAFTAQ